MNNMTKKKAKWLLVIGLLITYAVPCWIAPLGKTSDNYWSYVTSAHLGVAFLIAVVLCVFAFLWLIDGE